MANTTIQAAPAEFYAPSPTSQPSILRTLFVDTQGLIYAFEHKDPAWREFIDERLATGFRLVLAEEQLYEFGQSGTLEAALELVNQAVARNPLWVRSFIDIQADEVCGFARALLSSTTSPPVRPFFEQFEDISQVGERHKLDPAAFVRFAFNPRTVSGVGQIREQHASVLNELSKAVAQGKLTPELKERAIRGALRGRLRRGSDLIAAIPGADLDEAVKLCFKHHRRLKRECPSYATEEYLSNYRSSSPKRRARHSDSVDLLIACAAFPYVNTFVTHDGFLNEGLAFVAKHSPTIKTELLRRPPLTPERD